MADLKITQLTENTAPLSTDVLPMVDDPAGTPATQKVTVGNLNNYKIVTSSTRPGSPAEGMMIYETDTNLLLIYDGAAWTTITPSSATVATSQTTTSTTYTDLTTSGPAVTIQTGTKVLVTVSAYITNDVANIESVMGYAVSGATTLAASDTTATSVVMPGANVYKGRQSRTAMITGLTAGSNVFTAKYKRIGASGTATFSDRDITVVGIP